MRLSTASRQAAFLSHKPLGSGSRGPLLGDSDVLDIVAAQGRSGRSGQDALDGLEGTHLLAQARVVVKGAGPPPVAALGAVGAACARRGGGLGGREQERLDDGADGGLHQSRGPHEARQLALVRLHVNVAGAAALAGRLVQYVGGRRSGAKVGLAGFDKLLGAVNPLAVARHVGQEGGAVHIDAVGVGEGNRVDLLTVIPLVGAVDHVEVLVYEADARRPVKDLVGPVHVSLVAGGAGQASRQLEESSVADAVLVIEAVRVAGKYLPEKTTSTSRGIPPACQ